MCQAMVWWDGLRPVGSIEPPLEMAVDLAAAGPDLGDHLYLIHLAKPLQRSEVVVSGPVLRHITETASGTLEQVLPSTWLEGMLGFCDTAVKYRQPMVEGGSLYAGSQEYLYRNILLPLTRTEHGPVTSLLGALSYKTVEG